MRSQKEESRGAIVGVLARGVHYLFIDERLSEEDKSLKEETVLVNKKVSFGHNGSRR